MSGKINNGERHSTGKNSVPQIETQPSPSTSISADTVSALVSQTETLHEIRVSIIGKTGVGKSALGNALLQQDNFKSQQQTTSVTSECSSGQRHLQLNGVDTLLKVVDTPGLFDTGNSNQTIAKEIVKCINFLSPGPHLFLFVIRIDLRLSQEDIKVLEYFKNTFGELIDKFAVVVFTGKDQLDDRSEEDAMRELHAQLSTFSDVFKHRRFATINNKDRTEGKMKDVDRILQLLHTTIQNNGGDFYKNEMYEEAKKLFEARICDEEEDKQRALAEIDQLKKELDKRIHQELNWQKEKEQWTEERAQFIEDKRNKEIDLDKREMELKQKETEILRIQQLESERQSATSRQSYTELASTSTYQHAIRKNEKRIHNVSEDINISRPKKIRYEPRCKERGKMRKDDEENIKKNFVFLLDNITEPERLLDRLFGKSVFDNDDMENIRGIKGKRAMKHELLTRLLDGGSNSYQSFIDSLNEEGYTTVVEQLQSNTVIRHHINQTYGEISGSQGNQLMIREMGDRNQMMLSGIDEHYDVSHSEVGNRSDRHKECGEVDVVKVVVKKSNNTVIVSKVKSDYKNIRVKEEIISKSGYQVKNIANYVVYENPEPMVNYALEDEQEDHVETADVAVDMTDDQTAKTSELVGLAIKQEPLDIDETYGVTQPTILSSTTRQDIVYTDDQQDDVKLTTVDTTQTSVQNKLRSPSSIQPLTTTLSTPVLNQPLVVYEDGSKSENHPKEPNDDSSMTEAINSENKLAPQNENNNTTPDVITTNCNKTTDNNIMIDVESIYKTCQYGTLDEVDNLMRKNMSLNITDSLGQTPAFYCVMSDIHPLKKLKLLVFAGARLDVTCQGGFSILHQTCLYGTADCIKYLLEIGFYKEIRDNNNRTPVFYCIQSKVSPVEKLKLLYSAGASFDVKDHDGCSILDKACLYGTADCLKCLLEIGLDKEIRHNKNKTLIFYCIQSDISPVEKLKLLYSAGARFDVKDRDGCSILDKACEFSTTESVKYLLEIRLDKNGRDVYNSKPVFYCLRSKVNPVEKLKLLYSAGVSFDVKDRDGCSILDKACLYSTAERIKYLLEIGLDKDIRHDKNKTLIFCCVQSKVSPVEKLKLLYSAGARFDVKDRDGCSILDKACLYGTADCLKCLLEIGLDKEIRQNKNKLIFYCIQADISPVEKLKLLYSAGVSFDIKDRDGCSILDKACLYSTADCLKYLLEIGLDKEIRHDEKNKTLVLYCIQSKVSPVEKLKLLYSAGARFDVRVRSLNMLHLAGLYGTADCLKYFLDIGLDKEIRHDENKTLVHFCIWSGISLLEKLKLLYSAGARFDVKSYRGLSVLDEVRTYGWTECVTYLREVGLDK
ncbi:uncharacterized protein LOC126819074 [Patella vulgata]|uniref:uncharacterized protein LOC126819074 n=1 Tax=Patella vulgata TaxID=6465 RepID=UPI0021800E77|nr:uncharacterized protein LOC126819074 [Patella vulgata]XP_050402860.1 uncharacterized protein LOC126819074 [Patella vulgata]